MPSLVSVTVVARRDFGAVQIGAAENDADAGRGRRQHHAHLCAGMQRDAFGGDFAGDGAAGGHALSLAQTRRF